MMVMLLLQQVALANQQAHDRVGGRGACGDDDSDDDDVTTGGISKSIIIINHSYKALFFNQS